MRTIIAGVLMGSLLLAGVAGAGGPSELDPSFGGFPGSLEGRVLTDVGTGWDSASGVVIQPDGKIVVAGDARPALGLVRYKKDGSLDASFGSAGKVTTPEASAVALALQPDGKLVAVGDSKTDFAVFRYRSDGSPDTTFGTGGRVTTSFGPEKFGLALAVALQPDGNLDGSFGTGGKVAPTLADPSDGGSLAIQPDGKIVAGGGTGGSDIVLRFKTSGALDTSFGSGGEMIFPPHLGGLTDIALQPDGKIVGAGSIVDSKGQRFWLARLKTNGSLDPGFGSSGIVTTKIGSSTISYAHAVAVQADGRIVAAGSMYSFGSPEFALARYEADGSPDPSFGTGGTLATSFFVIAGVANAYAVALQPDGKIVAAGRGQAAGDEFTSDFAVARYLPSSAVTSPLFIYPAVFDLEFHTLMTVLACGKTSACSGTLIVEPPQRRCPAAPRARRACELGEQAFHLRRGGQGTIHVPLNQRGRAFVRSHRGGHARLSAISSSGRRLSSGNVVLKSQSALSASCPGPVSAGSPLAVTGTLTPALRGASIRVAFLAPSGAVSTQSAAVAPDGSYLASFTPSKPGAWQIQAFWQGSRDRFGAQAQPCTAYVVPPAPPPPPPPPPQKQPSSISINCPGSWQLGAAFPISGSIDPPDANAPVKLKYRAPQGGSTSKTVSTNSNGHYSDQSVKPNQTGTWKVTASWDGDAGHAGSEKSCSIQVQ